MEKGAWITNDLEPLYQPRPARPITWEGNKLPRAEAGYVRCLRNLHSRMHSCTCAHLCTRAHRQPLAPSRLGSLELLSAKTGSRCPKLYFLSLFLTMRMG